MLEIFPLQVFLIPVATVPWIAMPSLCIFRCSDAF